MMAAGPVAIHLVAAFALGASWRAQPSLLPGRHMRVGAQATAHGATLRMRGGQQAREGTEPLAPGRENLGRVLAEHAWRRQDWGRRALAVVSFALMGLSKVLGVQSSFALASAMEAATASVDAGDGTLHAARRGLLPAPAALSLALYVGCRVLAAACVELKRLTFTPVALGAARSFSQTAFVAAHGRPASWHESQAPGALDRIFTRGSRGFQTLLNAVTFNLGPTVLEVVLVISVLARKFGVLHAWSALATLTASILIGVVFNERRRALYAAANARENAVSTRFVDSMRLQDHVKLLGTEAAEARAYAGRLGALLRLRQRLAESLAALNFSQRGVFGAGLLVVLLLGLRDVHRGLLPPAQLITLNGLMRQLSSPVQQLGASYTIARQACVDLAAMCAVIGEEDEHGTRHLPALPESVGASLCVEGLRVVGARDPATGEETTLLDGLSLNLTRGELVGVVGPSGAGKSTLMRAITLLHSPDGGRILLDGHDATAYNASSVRARFSVVPQDSAAGAFFLHEDPEQPPSAPGKPPPGRWGGLSSPHIEPPPFRTQPGTDVLRAAVRYAVPHASDAKVARALDAVGLGAETTAVRSTEAATIADLKLSGGELQRLALARALAMDSPFILCDEPTAHLDALSTDTVRRVLRDASRTRGVLVIAHDLRVVDCADRILVLEGGRCVETGTHEELLARGGLYAQLWDSQVRDGAQAATLEATARGASAGQSTETT